MSLTVAMRSVSRSFCAFPVHREGGREKGAHPCWDAPPFLCSTCWFFYFLFRLRSYSSHDSMPYSSHVSVPGPK